MAKYSRAKRHARRAAKKHPFAALIILLILALIAGGVYYAGSQGLIGDLFSDDTSGNVQIDRTNQVASGKAELHFIDVGQADAALIKTEAGNVLIDVGTKSTADELLSYLASEGVSTVEYMIFTHPHDDHMGAGALVLEALDVKNVIMTERVSTALFFEQALDVIDSKQINTIKASIGDTYTLGDLKMTVLAPRDEEYDEDDINNSSIVMLVQLGETSAIFTGDAEAPSEQEILKTFSTDSLKCDLLKVGHHGSGSSTTADFLDALSPEYAVISVGEGNSYGHPSDDVLERLSERGIKTYTTMEQGNIVFISDGKTLVME